MEQAVDNLNRVSWWVFGLQNVHAWIFKLVWNCTLHSITVEYSIRHKLNIFSYMLFDIFVTFMACYICVHFMIKGLLHFEIILVWLTYSWIYLKLCIVVWPTMSCPIDWSKHSHVIFTVIKWWMSHMQWLKVTSRWLKCQTITGQHYIVQQNSHTYRNRLFVFSIIITLWCLWMK